MASSQLAHRFRPNEHRLFAGSVSQFVLPGICRAPFIYLLGVRPICFVTQSVEKNCFARSTHKTTNLVKLQSFYFNAS